MEWFEGYAALAIVVASFALAGSGWLRDTRIVPPDPPGLTAILAGMLWQVVVIGLIQLLVVMALRRSLTSSARVVSPECVEPLVFAHHGS